MKKKDKEMCDICRYARHLGAGIVRCMRHPIEDSRGNRQFLFAHNIDNCNKFTGKLEAKQ
jgi:hypothetical protein